MFRNRKKWGCFLFDERLVACTPTACLATFWSACLSLLLITATPRSSKIEVRRCGKFHSGSTTIENRGLMYLSFLFPSAYKMSEQTAMFILPIPAASALGSVLSQGWSCPRPLACLLVCPHSTLSLPLHTHSCMYISRSPCSPACTFPVYRTHTPTIWRAGTGCVTPSRRPGDIACLYEWAAADRHHRPQFVLFPATSFLHATKRFSIQKLTRAQAISLMDTNARLSRCVLLNTFCLPSFILFSRLVSSSRFKSSCLHLAPWL